MATATNTPDAVRWDVNGYIAQAAKPLTRVFKNRDLSDEVKSQTADILTLLGKAQGLLMDLGKVAPVVSESAPAAVKAEARNGHQDKVNA